MLAARVVVDAEVTSFRHPFFVVGRQPTFPVPPPSTIFGHCASALGCWPDPEKFWFGVHFTWRARVSDLEHQHIAKAEMSKRTGRLVMKETVMQPVVREMLFGASLTLYLPPELADAFRAPVYTVVLGRSQDLAEIRSVTEVELIRPERARLEHTILPWSVRPCVRQGSTVLLSRRITEPPARQAEFERYVVLREPVFFGAGAEQHPERAFTSVPGVATDDLYADASITDTDGRARGVWIHRIVGEL